MILLIFLFIIVIILSLILQYRNQIKPHIYSIPKQTEDIYIKTTYDRSLFAFNPSRFIQNNDTYEIFRWDSGRFSNSITKNISFHHIDHRSKKSQLEICKNNVTLFWKPKHFKNAYSYEDPRLFLYQKNLYCICYRRSFLQHKIVIFSILTPDKEIELDYKNKKSIEKNWCPFEWKGRLLILYTIYPTIILECDLSTGMCTEFFKDASFSSDISYHLGTPPIRFKHRFIGLMHYEFSKKYYRNAFYELDYETLVPSWPSRWFSTNDQFNIQYACNFQKQNDNTFEITLGIEDIAYSIMKLKDSHLRSFLSPYSFHEFFHLPVYIIYMSDKKRPAILRAQKYFSNIKIFEGILGRNIDRKKWVSSLRLSKNIDPKKKNGSVGCSASHIKIWQTVVKQKIPHCIIFEDDILFPKNWTEKLKKCFQLAFQTKNNYDLILLGNQVDSKKVISIVQTIPSFCLHAYILSYQGALNLLSLLDMISDQENQHYSGIVPIDCFTIELMRQNKLQYTNFIDLSYLRSDKFDPQKDARNTGLIHQDKKCKTTAYDA